MEDVRIVSLFWDMAAPAIHITGGDWSVGVTETEEDPDNYFAAERLYAARIYDTADEDGRPAAFLKGVGLYMNGTMLEGLFVYLPDYYERLGNYPLLSRQEAEEILAARCAAYLAGDHAYYDIDDTWRIVGVELVYFGNSNSRIRVPVYRFLITAAETDMVSRIKADCGLNAFMEVNISAVPEEYWHPDADGVWSPI